MAANKKYAENIIAKTIYDQFIEDTGLSLKSLPLYYTQDMINEIKQAKKEKIDVVSLSGKDWYKRLLQKKIFKSYNNITQNWDTNLTKVEYLMPHVDHQKNTTI